MQNKARRIRWAGGVVLGLLVSVAVAVAALPSPSFLPGQPMLAGSQVIMMWLPVPGATKYVVYLNDKKIGEQPTTQYIAPAPEGGGEFRYQVAGVDATGAEGPKSPAGVIRIISLDAPKGLVSRTEPDDKLIHLRWSGVKGAIIYNIYRAGTVDGEYSLLTSVQSTGFKDVNLEPATYYYKVSSRDAAGKESPKSEPLEVVLAKPRPKVAAVKLHMKILPTAEVERYEFLGDDFILEIADVKYEPAEDLLWVIERKVKKVFALNPADGSAVLQAGPYDFTPFKLDFGPDGNLYVTTLEGQVVVLDRSGEEVSRLDLVAPPADDAALWKGLPSTVKNFRPVAGDVLCFDNELWVSDQRKAVIEVFDYDGRHQRYLSRYTDASGAKVRFAAVGEMERLPTGNTLITFPLAHYAVAVDPDFNEVFTVGKRAEGFLAGFIGISGVFVQGDGNLLLTDPGVTSMQVFNGENGQYLYHVGGEAVTEDPGQAGRPLVTFGGIGFAQYDKRGDLFVYTGSEKALMKRRAKGDEPVAVE